MDVPIKTYVITEAFLCESSPSEFLSLNHKKPKVPTSDVNCAFQRKSSSTVALNAGPVHSTEGQSAINHLSEFLQ